VQHRTERELSDHPAHLRVAQTAIHTGGAITTERCASENQLDLGVDLNAVEAARVPKLEWTQEYLSALPWRVPSTDMILATTRRGH
jgi:hypothetical protein